MWVEIVMTYVIHEQSQKSIFIHAMKWLRGKAKKKEKTEMLMLLKRTAPKKLLQTSSILTTILLKFGDMVDVACDDIDES